MRNFLVVAFVVVLAGGLVWLALRPSSGSGPGTSATVVERTLAEGLSWIEREPTTGRLRLKVEADTALRDGDTTTTGPIRAWLYPETGDAPPTEIVSEGGRLASTGRGDPTIEAVAFDGRTQVRLPERNGRGTGGILVRGSGIRWSRASARIESTDPIRMEGDTQAWIEGRGFTLDPATRVVRMREVHGQWPM